MRVSARVRANRANAKKSTGPRTKSGKAASSRNAIRHGLSISPSLLVRPAAEIERAAQTIAGEGASAERLRAATEIAEAEFDLKRVRRARLDVMSDLKARERFASRIVVKENLIESIKRIDDDERSAEFWRAAIDEQDEDMSEFLARMEKMNHQMLKDGIDIAALHVMRMGRYERRAMTRRRRAIEEFDAVVEEETQASLARDAS